MAKKVKLSAIFVFLLFIPGIVGAASLYLSPSSGSFSVGQTATVQIYVSSADQAMNAVSGVISFPLDKLEVISLSKANSIISLWVQEPSYSNRVGTINFEGIVLNPGFIGSAGRLLSATFRVKAAGLASADFASGSVLANDGKGTNILTGLSGAEFALGDVVQVPTPTPIPSAPGTPVAPVISSLTHPDPDSWYANNDPEFSWQVLSGITNARLLAGRILQAIPTVVYTPAISKKSLGDLDDGVWYFHVQLRNASGWGDIAHYKFQIDTEKPTSFSVIELERDDPTDPIVQLRLSASDATSGIDHYEIQIDGAPAVSWQDDGSGIYKTLALAPGEYSVVVKAIDKAGNAAVETASVVVEALWPPTITEYPRELESGDILSIKGNATYPDSQVTVWIQLDDEEPKSYGVKSDAAGLFTFRTDEKLPEGLYYLWAEVQDERGAQSDASETVSLIVRQQPLFQIGEKAISVLAILIPIVAMLLLLAGLLWYAWQKFMQWKRKIRKEVKEAERALHKAINILKDDLTEQIHMLEHAKNKRKLTQEEDKIIDKLKKNLDDVEKFVGKEIRDIKKGLG